MALIRPPKRSFSPLLWVYRLVWEPALALAWCLAWWEKHTRLIPARWRLRARAAAPPPIPALHPVVWLHAASLGECKGSWALAQALAEAPLDFVLTATTVTGYDFLARQIQAYAGGARFFAALAPWDHPRLVRRFLKGYRVRALLLFEMELWPHYVIAAARLQVPVFWVSARWTPRAERFGRLCPGLIRSVLGRVDWVQSQTESEAARVHRRGGRRVSAGGDLRALHYLATVSESPPWPQRRGLAFLSLHAAELPGLLPALSALGGADPVYLFPRYLQEMPRFAAALSPLGFERLSSRPDSPRVLVDVFGQVGARLPHCHTAVVGGSFAPRGGHNLWEPLVAGTAIWVGPHFWNQAALAQRLRAAGLLRVATCLSAADLERPAADPAPACRAFVAGENRRLHAAVSTLRRELSVALPWPG